MLKTFPLKDIYLGKKKVRITTLEDEANLITPPTELVPELENLRKLCDEAYEKKKTREFPVRMDETSYRAALLRAQEDDIFVLRRMPSTTPRLETIGIHEYMVELLLTKGLTGLIVVAGAYGHGKTTTASSIISSRLAKNGGVAVTIEDPPEMPLEGDHGEGTCYQTWVSQGEFGESCRMAARWAPNIIFLGEVRDQETALEALKASINGRLVICTTHADSVSLAIERMYSLASGNAGLSEDYSSLLANGLTCVIHQTLEGDPKSKAPRLNFLWVGNNEEYEDAQGIRSNIRLRKWEQIENSVKQQKNKILFNKGL